MKATQISPKRELLVPRATDLMKTAMTLCFIQEVFAKLVESEHDKLFDAPVGRV